MKVIIDCDPGNGIPGANVDDAIALTVALRAPELQVAAIWSVFGNTAAPDGEGAARSLIAELGVPAPVIRQGFDEPLSGNREAWRQRLDAPRRDPAVCSLWDTRPPAAPPVVDTILGPLIDDLRAAGDGVTLACLGPLTNIARLIDEAPAALAAVERICLMGGALGFDELVDTNFAVDPRAASVVLHAGIPLVIVPLDATRATELSARRWREMLEALPADRREAGRAIDRWLSPWLEHSTRTRPVDGMWLHDLVVIALLLDPAVVVRRTERVSLARTPAGKLVRDPDGVAVELVTGVDNDRLIGILARALQ